MFHVQFEIHVQGVLYTSTQLHGKLSICHTTPVDTLIVWSLLESCNLSALWMEGSWLLLGASSLPVFPFASCFLLRIEFSCFFGVLTLNHLSRKMGTIYNSCNVALLRP